MTKPNKANIIQQTTVLCGSVFPGGLLQSCRNLL